MKGIVAIILCSFVGALLSINSVYAAPKNGLGVNVGYASHELSGKLDNGRKINYTSSGASYGIDYLFLVSPSFSLSPFFMVSSEKGGGDLRTDTSVSHGIFGMQGRYWFGPTRDFFIGVHIGRYSEALSNGDTASASGNGLGIAAGWESPDIPLFFIGQFDSTQIEYSDMDGDLTGLRISIGFRWK